MTVALRTAGTPTAATAAVTAINPAAPSGWQSGDISVLAVQIKPDTASITTPANWTKIGEWTGGTGAVGVDTGPTKTALYYRLDSPTAPGNLTLTGASAAAAVIHIFSKTLAEWNVENFTSAADTTHAANIATATGSNITLANGDLLLVNWAGANDGGSLSSPAVAATGSTFGAVTKRSEVSVTTGNDMLGATITASVTGGPSTGGPSFSASNTLNSSSGHASFLRLRDQAATLKHGSASGSLAAPGSASGHFVAHGSSSGSIAVSGASTGHTVRRGTSSGTIALGSTASGSFDPHGSANGTLSPTGTAAGSADLFGDSSGSLWVWGEAAGSTEMHGSASGNASVNGSASGTASDGNHASGTLSVAGEAMGHHTAHGAAEGSLSLAGQAVGPIPFRPTATLHASLLASSTTASLTPSRVQASIQPARHRAEVK